ncbi:hypothetical protein GCM10010492_22240 [Saccharothrix mutabilis subsp. mutabilis]|uniref:Uncharacterized protein n=1 Tax=Saccharothrix mutabilis subsp. mutabilis TaxID=66855 RepID=A0ABN0TK86_9PSEU
MTENDRNDDTTPQAGGPASPPPYVPPPGPPGGPGQQPAPGQPGGAHPAQPGFAPSGPQPTQPLPGQGAPGQGAPGQPGFAQSAPQPGQGGPQDQGGPQGPGGSQGPGGPQGGKPAKRGAVRQQQPGVTKPRPPSVAEQRARQQAAKQQREAAEAAAAEEARRRKRRKRLLIGGGVTVGVVGVVAIWYAVSSPDEVQAQCVKDDVVVEDKYCDESYARSHGGYHSNGFIYIGGSSYRYYYGGSSVPVGQKVSGGSYTIPKGANVTTKSGTTIQRGGFGISGGGKSGGS